MLIKAIPTTSLLHCYCLPYYRLPRYCHYSAIPCSPSSSILGSPSAHWQATWVSQLCPITFHKSAYSSMPLEPSFGPSTSPFLRSSHYKNIYILLSSLHHLPYFALSVQVDPQLFWPRRIGIYVPAAGVRHYRPTKSGKGALLN